MIILTVTKDQGFTLSLKDTLFEKPQEVGGGQIEFPSRFRVKVFIHDISERKKSEWFTIYMTRIFVLF